MPVGNALQTFEYFGKRSVTTQEGVQGRGGPRKLPPFSSAAAGGVRAVPE